MYLSHKAHVTASSVAVIALVPGLSRFDPPFAFAIIRKVGRKLKLGKPGSIHHMNDIRWTRGGRRGGGAQLPEQCTGPSV